MEKLREEYNNLKGVKESDRRMAEAIHCAREQGKAEAAPIEWAGAARALGDKAIAMWKNGEIKAKNEVGAMRVLFPRYVDTYGKPFDAASTWRSIKDRQLKEGK
jgi:hypothetical protein